MIIVFLWLFFGTYEWGHFTFVIQHKIDWVDFLVGLPFFLLLGPFFTITRLLKP